MHSDQTSKTIYGRTDFRNRLTRILRHPTVQVFFQYPVRFHHRKESVWRAGAISILLHMGS